jgi:hypothetical protein
MWSGESIEVYGRDILEEVSLKEDADDIASEQSAQRVASNAEACNDASILTEIFYLGHDLYGESQEGEREALWKR